MLRKARKRLADRDVISPQRRKDVEISAENTVGNGERWRERGVRFDAETRGRGGRRGEEGREKARDSGVRWAVRGDSGARVERSLDTAGRSACATSLSGDGIRSEE